MEECQGCLVGIAAGYGLNTRISITDRGKRFFSSSQRPDRFWGLPCLWAAISLGIRPGNEADHSPPSSHEVKNSGAIRPLPSHVFIWSEA
jgi:hypothetical protein